MNYRGEFVYFEQDRSDWPSVILIGECSRKPLTREEAEKQFGTGRMNIGIGACSHCFSEDGVQFWHVYEGLSRKRVNIQYAEMEVPSDVQAVMDEMLKNMQENLERRMRNPWL